MNMKDDIARILEICGCRDDAIEALCLYFTAYKKETGLAWYRKNKVRISENQKAYRDANPEKARAAARKRYAENKEQMQAYKAKNKVRIQEQRKATYNANPEKAKAASKKYYAENPEKAKAAARARYHLNTARENAKRLEKQLITTEP